MYKLRILFFDHFDENFGFKEYINTHILNIYISQMSFLSSVAEMVTILRDLIAFASHKCAFHRKKSRRYDVCMRRIWNVNYFDSRDSRLPFKPFYIPRRVSLAATVSRDAENRNEGHHDKRGPFGSKMLLTKRADYYYHTGKNSLSPSTIISCYDKN